MWPRSLVLFGLLLSPVISGAEVLWSFQADRSDPQALEGAVLKGEVAIWLETTSNPTQVVFDLDGVGATEGLPPFDFAGTAPDMSAMLFDTATISDGDKIMTVVVNGGALPETITVNFSIQNQAERVAPSDIDGTAISYLPDLPRTVNLTWTHDGLNITGFRAYFRLVQDPPVAHTIYDITDTDLREYWFSPGTDGEWEFYMTAFNGTLESAPSNIVSIELPKPCDIECWLNTFLPPEMTHLMRTTYIVRADVEPDAYYLVYIHPDTAERKCMKFFRAEAETNLDMPTNQRRGLISFVGAQLGEGERADHDHIYCSSDNEADFPVMPAPTGPVWVVAANIWGDTRPMYEWVNGERGKQIARIDEYAKCENESLRTSTRSGGRDREYRYATNAADVRGATLCWQWIAGDPVPVIYSQVSE